MAGVAAECGRWTNPRWLHYVAVAALLRRGGLKTGRWLQNLGALAHIPGPCRGVRHPGAYPAGGRAHHLTHYTESRQHSPTQSLASMPSRTLRRALRRPGDESGPRRISALGSILLPSLRSVYRRTASLLGWCRLGFMSFGILQRGGGRRDLGGCLAHPPRRALRAGHIGDRAWLTVPARVHA